MLELRPNCELCDKDLPPHAIDAHICTYECTYCTECVEKVHNVCIKCAGNFTPRPLRPKNAWRTDKNLGLSHHPASTTRVHNLYSQTEIDAHVARVKDIAPIDR